MESKNHSKVIIPEQLRNARIGEIVEQHVKAQALSAPGTATTCKVRLSGLIADGDSGLRSASGNVVPDFYEKRVMAYGRDRRRLSLLPQNLHHLRYRIVIRSSARWRR